MAKCNNCGTERDTEWDLSGIWYTCDGDWVCSQKCLDELHAKQDYFVQTVLSDDRRFAAWLCVPLEMVQKPPKEKRSLTE